MSVTFVRHMSNSPVSPVNYHDTLPTCTKQCQHVPILKSFVNFVQPIMLPIFKPSASSLALSQVSSESHLEQAAPTASFLEQLPCFLLGPRQGFQTSLDIWAIQMPYTTDFKDPDHKTYGVVCSKLNLHPPFHRHSRYRITIPGSLTRQYTFVGAIDLDPNNNDGEEWVWCIFIRPDLFHQQHLAIRVPKIFVWVRPENPEQDAVEQCPGWWRRQAFSPVWRSFRGVRR